ncbi:MAG: DUF4366 domain-containing protein [Clostridia bacterium]|nr:DUF4366 domain-containing protein [Clostridia bacterium]
MKENVKLIRSVLKILAVAVLFILVVSAKSFAVEPNNGIDGLDLDFVNIPENNTSNNTTTEDEDAKKKAEEEAKKKAEEEAAKKTTNTSTSTSTSSASSTKMPATGSNTEVIFVVGAVILISGAVFVFKKQNIKLK